MIISSSVAHRNRVIAALSIFAGSPLGAVRYVLRSLTRNREPVRLKFGTLWLWVRPTTTDLKVVRTCLLGEFDTALSYVPRQHNLIIDGGGYIGLTSILFASRFPKAQVLCLEPSAENYALAQLNCSQCSNIQVINVALAPKNGAATLRDRGTGHWGFTIVEGSKSNESAPKISSVATVTIDELLKRYGKDGVDLLKLDIEGGEYALLRDCPDWIQKCEVIVVELHDRISPGATPAFLTATQDREEVWADGEKRISIKRRSPSVAQSSIIGDS